MLSNLTFFRIYTCKKKSILTLQKNVAVVEKEMRNNTFQVGMDAQGKRLNK